METWQPGDPEQVADSVSRWFSELHRRAPSGVFTAPGRVNLIGEHVDYNGGLCLPIALPHATYAAVAAREDDTVTVHSRQQDDDFSSTLGEIGPGLVEGWPAYSAGVLWAMREAGVRLPGMDIVVDSRVPVGSGLSSSAAVECAVALGAVALAGTELDDAVRADLVRACMRAESEVAGAPTGGLDQTIALFGRAESALLLDCRDWSRRQVGWDPDSAGFTLLVIDTRASHTLTDGGYAQRVRECQAAGKQLGVELLRDVTDADAALASLDDEVLRRRVRHVLSEIARVREAVDCLAAEDFAGLGAAMTASHLSLRDDYEVSCEELDVVVEVALEHGALGARMTGGGFGGSAIALVPAETASAVGDAVTAAYDERGWRAPGLLTAVPGPGARRLR